MEIGIKVVQLRKEQLLSRDELGKKVGTSGAVIGRYERNEITPSVEMAAKIAGALNVSLDYLVGNVNSVVKDKKMVYRLEMLQKIGTEQRDKILYVLDTLLKDAQVNEMQQRLV